MWAGAALAPRFSFSESSFIPHRNIPKVLGFGVFSTEENYLTGDIGEDGRGISFVVIGGSVSVC